MRCTLVQHVLLLRVAFSSGLSSLQLGNLGLAFPSQKQLQDVEEAGVAHRFQASSAERDRLWVAVVGVDDDALARPDDEGDPVSPTLDRQSDRRRDELAVLVKETQLLVRETLWKADDHTILLKKFC